MNTSKIRDTIMALALIGTWLMMPPMLEVFQGPSAIFGMPTIVVYLFGVWLALIVTTALVARHVARSEGQPSSDHPQDTDPYAIPSTPTSGEDLSASAEDLPPPTPAER